MHVKSEVDKKPQKKLVNTMTLCPVLPSERSTDSTGGRMMRVTRGWMGEGGMEGGGGLTSLLNNKLLYLMSPINHKARRRRRPALSVSACSADVFANELIFSLLPRSGAEGEGGEAATRALSKVSV